MKYVFAFAVDTLKEKVIHWLNMRLPVFAFTVIHKLKAYLYSYLTSSVYVIFLAKCFRYDNLASTSKAQFLCKIL